MSLFDVILTQLSMLPFDTIISKIFVFALIIAITWFIGSNIKYVIDKLLRKAMPYYYVNVQIYIKWIVWLTGLFFGLNALGLSEQLLEIVIIMLGVGVLIGIRDALTNILSRPFLDIYSDYKVGDWIKVGEFGGKVIEVNALNTILITKSGDMAVVPNSHFIKNVMVNESYQTGYEVTVPIVVDQKADDIELEKEVMRLTMSVKKYLKPDVDPSIITIKTDERSKELALTLTIKERENKAVVVEKMKEEIKKLLDKLQTQ